MLSICPEFLDHPGAQYVRHPQDGEAERTMRYAHVNCEFIVESPTTYSQLMKVALTVNDFLSRAERVYPDRIAVVDEPDQPAESWGAITYRDMAERARAMAAGLDALGIQQGERIAMVSHNSARLLTAFFGVSGSGRVLVPINFRLVAAEVSVHR